MFTTQSPLLVFSSIFLIFVLFIITRPAYTYGVLPHRRKIFAILIALLFCLFAFWGKDWFGYLLYYNDIQNGHEISSLEDVYNVVGKYCPSYIVFRLVIWGTALLFLFKTFKHVSINKDVALFFFCVIYLIWFSYARASLAMAVMFWGYSMLTTKSTRTHMTYIIGVLFIGVSFYLHKSAILAIVAIGWAEILQCMGKRFSVFFPLLLFPMVVLIFSTHLSGAVGMIVSDEGNMLNEYAAAGNSYLDSDKYIAGPGVVLQWFLERAPYYLLVFISLKVLLSEKIKISEDIKKFMFALYIIVLFSTVFAFDLGVNTSAVYGRLLRFAQIPACIVLTYLYSNRIYPKLTKIACSISFISTVYSLLYVLYNSYVAQG